MARKDEDKELDYIIPKNFKETNVTPNGIPYRNIVEAVILVGIVVGVLWIIPNDAVSLKFKIIIGAVIGGPLGILGITGINKCSLSEYLLYVIRFKTSPKVYVRKHLYKRKNDNEEK